MYYEIMQVFVGDQLTCKNIRGAKLWRAPEINPENRLQWANETPGMYKMCVYVHLYYIMIGDKHEHMYAPLLLAKL